MHIDTRSAKQRTGQLLLCIFFAVFQTCFRKCLGCIALLTSPSVETLAGRQSISSNNVVFSFREGLHFSSFIRAFILNYVRKCVRLETQVSWEIENVGTLAKPVLEKLSGAALYIAAGFGRWRDVFGERAQVSQSPSPRYLISASKVVLY